MALDMTPEQKQLGKDNFRNVVEGLAQDDKRARESGLTRRDFIKSAALAGATVVPVSAAVYFGYTSEKEFNKPVKAAIIGTGDEGGVLVNEHNPKYLEFVAYCDIRPSNQERIFTGDPGSAARKGFNNIPEYGKKAKDKIKFFEKYEDLLKDTKLGIEAVVIALPLHMHHPAAMAAMEAGKHVLCEKLMARDIKQCKEMIRKAEEKNVILQVGHQRHYSMLYAHAVEVIQSGVLGDIKHIRALWHRNNSWPRVDPKTGLPKPGELVDSWRPAIKDVDIERLKDRVTSEFGYKSMEELVRWRLYNRTGAGLMAELGSHQLDACSIFLQAQNQRLWRDHKIPKVRPLAVSGVGGKYFYHDDREIEDHVFVTFEFPGPTYYSDPEQTVVKNKDDVVVLTYSSVSTNAFESYGECVMGNRGTMVVEMEQSIMLYPERDPNLAALLRAGGPRATSVTVASTSDKQPVLDTSASPGGAGPAAAGTPEGARAINSGPVSRGYREEMEHFAHCIRRWNEDMSKERPRCDGPVAMADAIIALTSNRAMREHARITFDRKWFDAKVDDVPDPKA